MCEVLLRVTDQIGDDVYKDVKLTKAGHIIVIMPDGWGWSAPERTVPFWRIIALPGVEVSAIEALLDTEQADRLKANLKDPMANQDTNPMLQIRAWSLDFTKLPVKVQAALAAPRTGTGILTASHAAITAAQKKYTPRTNPNVIG